MLLLDAASKLQLTASIGGSIDYQVSKIRNASPQTPIPTKGNITGTGATDICAVPGGTDVDTVESIIICNAGVVAPDITINSVGGTTVRVLKVLAFNPGESIVWTETGIYFRFDAYGNAMSVSVPDTGRTYDLMSIATTVPVAPIAGKWGMWGQKWAGRTFPVVDADAIGNPYRLQPGLFGNGITLWKPGTGAVSPPVMGGGTVDGGTLTHPALASTNFRTQNRHSLYANVVTTTNQILGRRAVEAACWRGNAALMGGFFFFCRFGFGLVPAGTRLFVGLSSLLTGVQVSADPSAAADDHIGMAMDLADTNITIMTKDNTTNTKTAIGAGLAKAANVLYDFYMFCKANDTQIYCRIDQYASATGVMTNLYDAPITTTIPRNTIFLSPMALMSNGTANTTVNTVQLAIASLYLETDF